MKKLILAILLPTMLAVVGCQSAPIYGIRSGFSALPTSNGRVLISFFHIPKEEPAVKAYLVLGILAGANTNVAFIASVYDVTGDIQYIGTVDSNYGPNGWLEYDAPAGKRILMLALGPPFREGHTDFIEIVVEPGKVQHIALSQYGFTRRPYLGEIRLDDKHRGFCSSQAADKPWRLRRRAVEDYMTANNMSPYARDFSNYCFALSNVQVRVPNEDALKLFAESKALLKTAHAKGYEQWKHQSKKRPPYDLMQSYEPAPDFTR